MFSEIRKTLACSTFESLMKPQREPLLPYRQRRPSSIKNQTVPFVPSAMMPIKLACGRLQKWTPIMLLLGVKVDKQPGTIAKCYASLTIELKAIDRKT